MTQDLATPPADATVAPVLPLALLEAIRAHDRPGGELLEDDPLVQLPRRLGLSDVVETQIRRYREAGRRGVPPAEVLDLRSLMPWDYEAVMHSVAKTGRAVLVADAPRHASFLSEVAGTIAEDILDMLLAPPLRVTGFDTPYPYAQDKLYMPTVTRILNAAKRALDY